MQLPSKFGRITPQSRLALLMHGNLVSGYGKMGLGLLRYSEAEITAVVDCENPGGSVEALTGIPRNAPIVATVEEAARMGADTLVLGVANPGGVLPPDWWEEIKTGLSGGMSLVNGLHAPLAHHPELVERVQPGRFIWDVRQEPEEVSNGTGAAATLSAKRILAVGTDMAVGKMTAMIEMDRLARSRGLRSKLLATGQIGICITGEGVALDAVRLDFAPGVIEAMVMRHGPDHDYLFVEGQGAAFNPASSAWLPLIRGSVPTHLILVHRAGQETIGRFPNIRIPPLTEAIRLYEAVCAAGGAFPTAKVAGIALNTAKLSEEEAQRAIRAAAEETGLPVTDAVRYGAAPLLDAVIK